MNRLVREARNRMATVPSGLAFLFIAQLLREEKLRGTKYCPCRPVVVPEPYRETWVMGFYAVYYSFWFRDEWHRLTTAHRAAIRLGVKPHG